jgi:phosphoglycerate dehydrogenase-like enzyme
MPIKLVLPAPVRPMLESRLPPGVNAHWFEDAESALAELPDADAAWLDMQGLGKVAGMVKEGRVLRWLFTLAAGIEFLDRDMMKARGITVTNGAGLNAAPVADYAVMGVLAGAKRFDEVVRMADRHEWTGDAPGRLELDGSRALIIGYGAIGRAIGERLRPFGVSVTGVTRSGREGTLKGDAWQAELGRFDWIIIAAPATEATHHLLGAAELRAMKPTAWLINVGRGGLVDQAALVEALHAGTIAGAFLDTVTPEPLPADDPLWSAPNCMVTMHFSGRSQTGLFGRAVDLFLENLDAFLAGRPMRNVVDLDAGY